MKVIGSKLGLRLKPIDRLLQLPAVFTLNAFCKLDGLSRDSANTLIMRLADQGRVAYAGPKAGVYFNLLVDRTAAENHKLEAVRLAYPDAIVVGAAVLHAHGWTTQIPLTIDVAVLKAPSLKTFFGVNIVQRSKQWYEEIFEEVLGRDKSPFEIDSLTPLQALKDLKSDPDLWQPDPDDLDIPEGIDGFEETAPDRYRG